MSLPRHPISVICSLYIIRIQCDALFTGSCPVIERTRERERDSSDKDPRLFPPNSDESKIGECLMCLEESKRKKRKYYVLALYAITVL